jgi:mRNA-degrading endonuclease RelE of RelBE toxin-antitoxin system
MRIFAWVNYIRSKRPSERNNTGVYTIKFTTDGLDDVKALPKGDKNALKTELIKKLSINPKQCGEPLLPPLGGWYSFHYLEYRVIYRVYDDLLAIAIAGVGKHNKDVEKDIYRRLEDAAKNGRLAESVLVALRDFTSSQQEPL